MSPVIDLEGRSKYCTNFQLVYSMEPVCLSLTITLLTTLTSQNSTGYCTHVHYYNLLISFAALYYA